MSKRFLWDTGALFLFFGGHDVCNEKMHEIEEGSSIGFIPRPVLIEFHYKTMEKLGKRIAAYQFSLLRESTNTIIDYDLDDVPAIASLKVRYKQLSYVDSIVCHLAITHRARIITSDGDFEKVKGVKTFKIQY